MLLQRWRAKHLLMYPFGHNRFGENLYEWMTAVALGTQKGMSKKWCYWFREHVVLCRRYARVAFPGKRLWLFEPGWSVAPVILGRLATSRDLLVTEDYPRMSDRYISMALSETGKAAAAVCRSAGVEGKGRSLLEDLQGFTSSQQLLDRCGVRYHVGEVNSLREIAPASIDACFSMGRLEHFSEEDLVRLLGHMQRILAPGGVASHIVDHRDHFWHYDKNIHCFHHLIYSDREWAAIAKGRHLYRNRLLERDYIRLFRENGFEVLAAVHDLHRRDAEGIDPGSLWGPYAELAENDLEAAVSHFVVRRP